jgi:uncharacterized protein (DUF885 family)
MTFFGPLGKGSCIATAKSDSKSKVKGKGTIMTTLELFFNELIELNPSLGSFIGRREFDGMYENVLSSEYEEGMRRLLSKYKKNAPNTTLDDKILRYVIKEQIRFRKVKNLDLLPVLYSFSNVIIEFTSSNKNFYPLETSQDFRNVVKRHRNFMEFMDSCIKHMKKGMKCGVVLSKFICKRMITRLDNFYNDKSYVIEDVPEEYGHIFKEYRRKLKALICFIKTKYLKKCISGHGLYYLPNGKNMYKYFVKQKTTTDKSAVEIHQIGLKEVARIKSELELLKTKMGYSNLTLLEFYDKMRTDPNNYYTTSADVLNAYKSTRDLIETTVIPKFFRTQVTPYEIRPVPKEQEDGNAGAYYFPGNSSGRAGVFYVNTRNTSQVPNGNAKFNMVALTLHEGNPGHHYQFQYALDEGIPDYRTNVSDGTAYAEGWGLYAESLGDVLYDQTTTNGRYNYYGRLNYEMFRALRLVVDTGIHYYGWSHKKALKYMLKYSSLEKGELDEEVERYICWPGQALAYKIGQMFISDLKTEYMKKPGADIKVFHERVLENGILPLELLGEQFV